MTRPKRCPPGHLWLARDEALAADFCRTSLYPFFEERGGWVSRDSRGNGASGFSCLSGARRTAGRAPRVNTAIRIDTTRREWWCPKCKHWYRNVWTTIENNPERFCVRCPEKLTRSRCILVETIRLKGKK